MKLEVKNLTFAYESEQVLKNISLSLEAGEILCLLGPNGGGKTTLFKIILGLVKKRQGSIMLDREDIGSWPKKKIARYIGYVPQNHTPLFPFTVEEIVLMGRTPFLSVFGSPSPADFRIVGEALETLNISHLKNKSYTMISGGERQLVLIARALAQKPKFLILDEPTANLDFGNQVKVLRHIRNLARQGMGVIISTHVPDHALRFADKVFMLKDGGIFTCGSPEETINEHSMKCVYGIDTVLASISLQQQGMVRVCVPS